MEENVYVTDYLKKLREEAQKRISNLKNRLMNLLICFCIITLIHMMGVCTE